MLAVALLGGLGSTMGTVELARDTAGAGIRIDGASQRFGDVLRHRLGHRIGGTRALLAVVGTRGGLGDPLVDPGDRVACFVADLARSCDLDLGDTTLPQPALEIRDARFGRRELRDLGGERGRLRGGRGLCTRVGLGELGLRSGKLGLRRRRSCGRCARCARRRRELLLELGDPIAPGLELHRHVGELGGELGRAHIERTVDLRASRLGLGELLLELGDPRLGTRGARIRSCEVALGALRADLHRGEVLLHLVGARGRCGELIRELLELHVARRRRRRRPRLLQLVLQLRDHHVRFGEPLRGRDPGLGLGDHLGLACSRDLDARSLEIRRARSAQLLELVARATRIGLVRAARLAQRADFLEHLADALDERIALVLDGRARLALHLEPQRERAVQAHRRRQRAADRQQPQHQAPDQHDLAGRHLRALDLVRPDVDPVRAAEILDPQRALLDVEPGVDTRHAWIVASDRALRRATDRDRVGPQRERTVDTVDVAIDEGRHSLPAKLTRAACYRRCMRIAPRRSLRARRRHRATHVRPAGPPSGARIRIADGEAVIGAWDPVHHVEHFIRRASPLDARVRLPGADARRAALRRGSTVASTLAVTTAPKIVETHEGFELSCRAFKRGDR